MTEWDEFKQLDLSRVAELVNEKVLVDARNLYDSALLKRLGFSYENIGRSRI